MFTHFLNEKKTYETIAGLAQILVDHYFKTSCITFIFDSEISVLSGWLLLENILPNYRDFGKFLTGVDLVNLSNLTIVCFAFHFGRNFYPDWWWGPWRNGKISALSGWELLKRKLQGGQYIGSIQNWFQQLKLSIHIKLNW